MEVREAAEKIKANVEKAIVGKGPEIELVLTALFARGHVLLEDVPGTGKTQLAKALAKSLDCGFSRVQFTPDLLPSDLTGINFYNPKTGDFHFRRGSLFTNILLGDEINRATPRTQSGLLESMEERQITVDQTTYPLGEPYFVIATQNPVETHGTFPLPEAQLDRFMMQLGIGYPSSDETAQIICERAARDPLPEIAPVCGRDEIIEIQSKARGVFIHAEVARYITSLAESTRSNDSVALGISTRGAIALARASQAYAAISGRVFVIPDDVKRLLPYVFAHRLILRGGAGDRLTRAKRAVADAIETTPVPVEDFGKAARVG